MRVCQTMVVRPRWRGVHSAFATSPMGTAAKKLVLLSTVVVDWPGLRLAVVDDHGRKQNQFLSAHTPSATWQKRNARPSTAAAWSGNARAAIV